RKVLSPEQLDAGYRLACQTKINNEMVINIPQEVRFFEQKVLEEGLEKEVKPHPSVEKVFLELPQPSLQDQSSDVDRLLRCLDGSVCRCGFDLDLIRGIPTIIREADFKVTAVLNEDEIVCVESGDTTSRCFGIAFDIGTTTVVGMLTELRSGKRLAVSSRTNPQVVYGDDVISRITYASQNAHGLWELQKRIVGCLNEITAELCQASGVKREEIYDATVAGNTTMNHLFLGVDPHNIAQAPYVAVIREGVNIKASDIGLELNPCARVYVMPNIAGFVGGDTVAMILSSGMMHSDRLRLAIDIGTNGEVVLGTKDRMICCSCAAGPAFEGARIKFGMRAAEGAIEKVVITDDVEINVIGNVPARGLCGTALIDTVAELLRVGIVDPMGRILPPDQVNVSDALKRRIVEGENGFDFILAREEEAHNGEPVLITQRDIRELQLAKGAIFAGIQILKGELGVSDDDIDEILLAGAFGNFIRRSMAKRIGLLPDIPTERIRFIGNAAGAGARLALISRRCREEATAISEKTEYIELGGRPDFQEQFALAMMFPEE
ncbi:MAG: hypothetical protein DRN07_06460, partial [Thermoplasmata archaeon]